MGGRGAGFLLRPSAGSFRPGAPHVLSAVLGLTLGAAAVASAQPTDDLLAVAGGRIRLTITSPDLEPAHARLRAWVERSAAVVAGYYGRFPVDDAYVYVRADTGQGVGHGVTFRDSIGIINISVSPGVTERDLGDDWVMVHEMTHLALPNLHRRHTWLSEGLATYIGSVARAQAGHPDAAHGWAEFVDAMPLGLPRQGEGGLDDTPTWGRTYWGGALFCLLADVEIQHRTKGMAGLRDGLKAVALEGRTDASVWPIERVLRTADLATGVTVLADLYAEMNHAPVSPDLDALWASLGVVRAPEGVQLTDAAPRADIRRAIMERRLDR